MIFASLEFLFAFLPLFFIFYYIAGHFRDVRGKNLVFYIFSLIFYGWGEPIYILLMFYSTTLDYTCGLMINKYEARGNMKAKKAFLWASLIGNLGPLFIFKYLGFTTLTMNSLLGFTGLSLPVAELALPIGISFYTFQTMSYSIDVYLGKVAPQRNIINFGTYVVMFPQLIAGPVVRYETVAAELNERTETQEDFAIGLRRFVCGLAKKTLIANTMASVVDSLFAYHPSELGFLGASVAVLAYTFQIFYDFSGYSDMAIGMGRMMGFHYLENFQYPYICTSVTDFWRRWHISMSTFFRDYIYIPLGGNRVPQLKWVRNMLVVWFLTGLWHGAEWNFVLWGLYFGLLLMFEKFFLLKYLQKCRIINRIWSLLCVIYGWVIFRCEEGVGQLAGLTKALFGAYGFQGTGDTPAVLLLQYSDFNTVFVIMFIAGIIFSMPVGDYIIKRIVALGETHANVAQRVLPYAGDAALVLLLILCTVQLALGAYNPFIYFRF